MNANSIFISLIINSIASVIFSRKLVSKIAFRNKLYGELGVVAIFVIVLLPLVASMSWLLGITVRRLEVLGLASQLRGIGGGDYGEDYQYYVQATFVRIFSSAIILFGISVWELIIERHPMLKSSINQTHFKKFQISQQTIEVFLVWGTICNLIIFINGVGIDYLFASDLNRFDNVQTYRDGVVVRISTMLSLLFGLSAVVLPKSNLLATILSIANIVPALVTASRIYSVVGIALLLNRFFMPGTRLKKLIFSPLVVYVCLMIYALPLVQRNGAQGGFRSVVVAATDLVSENLMEVAALNLINIGQGFGVVVEAISVKEQGSREFDFPIEYFLMQFSPLPSAIDGYDRNWLQFNPRINEFTPINFHGHLILVHYLTLIIQPIIILSLLIICSMITIKVSDPIVFSIFATGAIPFAFIAEQYPPRNGLRILELASLVAMCYAFGSRTLFSKQNSVQ